MIISHVNHAAFHLGDRLEVLYYLVKNYCGGGQVLDIRGPDPTTVKKACMDLLTSILCQCEFTVLNIYLCAW